MKSLFENYNKSKKERDQVAEELHKLDMQSAELAGERRGLLHGLGWTGLTDEEVTWVCNRIKIKGKFLFQPTVDQIRQMIADDKEPKQTLEIEGDK
jgi:hypothetical protein